MEEVVYKDLFVQNNSLNISHDRELVFNISFNESNLLRNSTEVKVDNIIFTGLLAAVLGFMILSTVFGKFKYY